MTVSSNRTVPQYRMFTRCCANIGAYSNPLKYAPSSLASVFPLLPPLPPHPPPPLLLYAPLAAGTTEAQRPAEDPEHNGPSYTIILKSFVCPAWPRQRWNAFSAGGYAEMEEMMGGLGEEIDPEDAEQKQLFDSLAQIGFSTTRAAVERDVPNINRYT